MGARRFETLAEAEVWLPIPGHEGYEASNAGRIRSIDRVGTQKDGRVVRYWGRVLAPAVRPTGHLTVTLQRNNVRKTWGVHRFVLLTFAGPAPEGMQGCHNDGNPQNNRIENLRWDTPKANSQDTIKHGRNRLMLRTHCPRGHRLRAPNLTASKATLGHRNCLACNRAQGYIRHFPGSKSEMQAIADRYYEHILTHNGERRRTRDRHESHCRRGHARTELNTYVTPAGTRQCRTCRQLREYKPREKAA